MFNGTRERHRATQAGLSICQPIFSASDAFGLCSAATMGRVHLEAGSEWWKSADGKPSEMKAAFCIAHPIRAFHHPGSLLCHTILNKRSGRGAREVVWRYDHAPPVCQASYSKRQGPGSVESRAVNVLSFSVTAEAASTSRCVLYDALIKYENDTNSPFRSQSNAVVHLSESSG